MTMRKRIMLVFILIAAGAVAWATQQTWRVFIVHQSESPIVENPDGSVTAVRSAVAVSSNDPNFTQAAADEQWAAMQQAIADGNFRLREAKETNGMTVYLYDITLPDGRVMSLGSSKPMEELQVDGRSDGADE